MSVKNIAFFTPEVALDQSLHNYSGGLGVVSGSFLISARKLGVPMVGVTLLYTHGYYDQTLISANGRKKMAVTYIPRDYEGMLEKTGIKFQVTIKSTPVWIEVLTLPGGKFGSSPCVFLRTDIPENDYLSRLITAELYGGNPDRRIAQSIILGRGGVQALQRLGIPVRFYHLNESFACFAGLEIFKTALDGQGGNFNEALKETKKKVVFTTHTPVSAGNPCYDIHHLHSLINRNGVFAFNSDFLRRIGGDPFNMTAACLRLAGQANAVSLSHLRVAKEMWSWVENSAPLVGIANGVSADYWQYPEFKPARNTQTMRDCKAGRKESLFEHLAGFAGTFLGRDISGLRQAFTDTLVITWARRFAEYKRPELILADEEWLKKLLDEGKIFLIIAGKPHPHDMAMINAYDRLLEKCRRWSNFFVLPGYELELSRRLKAGSDLWLNTPRVPHEACGTSGMSAALNGALNASTADGWMNQANPNNCFLFGRCHSVPGQDWEDAKELKECLKKTIDCFYNRPDAWYQMALAAKLEAEENWTSDRMVRDYCRLLYCLNDQASFLQQGR